VQALPEHLDAALKPKTQIPAPFTDSRGASNRYDHHDRSNMTNILTYAVHPESPTTMRGV
jgi:hypothetical protein